MFERLFTKVRAGESTPLLNHDTAQKLNYQSGDLSPSFNQRLQNFQGTQIEEGQSLMQKESLDLQELEDMEPVYSSKLYITYEHMWGLIALVIFTVSTATVIRMNRTYTAPSMNEVFGGYNKYPMSIKFNEGTNEFAVVDNFPLTWLSSTTSTSGKEGFSPNILVSGNYLKNVENNGWHYLTMRTLNIQNFVTDNLPIPEENNQNYYITQQKRKEIEHTLYFRSMKALGYLEGYVTCEDILQWYHNYYDGLYEGLGPNPETLEFLQSNHDWMRSQVDQYAYTNDYWFTVKGLLEQMEGMLIGMKEACPGTDHIATGMSDLSADTTRKHAYNPWEENLYASSQDVFLPSMLKSPSLLHMLLMNANGDMYQITQKYDDNDDMIDSQNSEDLEEDTMSSSQHQDNDKSSSGRLRNLLQVSVTNTGKQQPSFKPKSSPKGKAPKISLHDFKKHHHNVIRTHKMHPTIIEYSNTSSFNSTKSAKKGVTNETFPDSSVHHDKEQEAFRTRRVLVNDNVWKEFHDKFSNQKIWNRAEYLHAITQVQENQRSDNNMNINNTDMTDQNRNDSRNTSTLHPIIQEALNGDFDIRNSSQLFPKKSHKKRHSRHTVGKYGKTDHCSVIIKILPGTEDIVFAHNTWDNYQMAYPRIMKHYSYNLVKDLHPVGMYDSHFSSSPGLLSSVDDFYILHGHGHLVVTETSLDVYNTKLLTLITPQSMLSYMRARVANVLSASAKQWVQTFALYHSGTYINQWMILDMQLYHTQTKQIAPEFFFVFEETPGYFHYEDMTTVLLNQTYWASFNNPYFEDIAILTGQQSLCAYDTNECYAFDPRGRLFAQYQSSLTSIQDVQNLILHNDYQHDPVSKNDSCHAIACREDLEPESVTRYAFGAIDSKVSSVRLAQQSVVPPNALKDSDDRRMIVPLLYAYLGPSNHHQTPFCWDKFAANHSNSMENKGIKGMTIDVNGKRYIHDGHPNCFNFSYQLFPPSSILPRSLLVNTPH